MSDKIWRPPIAQEALHNTVKHAQASKVELRLDSASEGIFLEIRDNGIGFDSQASFPGHLGLHSMRERITGLGGILQLESYPGQGTCISVWLPLESIEKRRTGMLG